MSPEDLALPAVDTLESHSYDGRSMGAFGECMQREREMRGITLEEVSESTKITIRCLRALEEEKFDKLPGGIFNKGFVRAYARHLGIDEDAAVAKFMAASGGEPEQPLPDPAVPRAVALGQRPKQRLKWGRLALLVLLLATAAAAWKVGSVVVHSVAALSAHLHRPKIAFAQAKTAPAARPVPVMPASAPVVGATKQPPAAVKDQSAAPVEPVPAASAPAPQPAPSVAAAPTPAPAAKSSVPTPTPVVAVTAPAAPPSASNAIPAAAPPVSSSPAPAPTPPAPASFLVEVRARRGSWVQIVADGKLLSEGVLIPPAEKSVRAATAVVVKTGNAAGVEVSFNGQPLASLGQENQMATVTFTAAGIQH